MNSNNTSSITETINTNKVAPSGSYDFATKGGIDSLYYFIESKSAMFSCDAYERFFINLEIDLADAREFYGGFIPKEAFCITIADKEFVYYGKTKGFHFFGDKAGWLRVGFKDSHTNLGVKDIQVQLQATGIYLLGLKPLFDYVNNVLLASISKPVYTVSRADLNIFCQINLGAHLSQDNVVTRKRKFVQLFGTKSGYETMYIGKPPFRVRIYDKREELRNSPKYEMMGLYFIEHGLNPAKHLWNLEFECHREFLKSFKINTVDDLFENTDALFHKFMTMVRFIDPSTVTKNERDGGRLYRGETSDLWNYLDHSFKFDAHLQTTRPLERLIPKQKEYTASHFLDDFRTLITKGEKEAVTLNQDDIRDILHQSNLWLTPKAKERLKPYTPIHLEMGDARYLLTRNFTPVPTLPSELSPISNNDLDRLLEALTKALHQESAKKNLPDDSLIVKNISLIEQEWHRRRVRQKELELWQQ